jgi:type III pantothenate kinase
MASLNLCIDIGNTTTKAALYKAGIELKYYPLFTVKDFEEIIKNQEVRILVSKTGSNALLEEKLSEENYLSHKTALPIELNYDTPETLGADRIATAVGAFAMSKEAAWLVIDLGTCLTIDLVANGSFEGGVISPGAAMRFKAMHEFTAALPQVKFNNKVSFPGKTTEESMQVGVYQSIVNEIKGYVGQLEQQFKALKIVDCSRFKIDFDKEVKKEIFARPKLVLEGLNFLLEQNVQ